MEWINLANYSFEDSLKERAPFDHFAVLVIEPANPTRGDVRRVVTAWFAGGEWRTESETEYGQGYRVIHPTHWMPLPELPIG